MSIEIHIHESLPDSLPATLSAVLDRLAALEQKVDLYHQEDRMADQELTDVLSRIDDATNNVAEDIQTLLERIRTGMSAAEVTALKQELADRAARLETIGADVENPVPEEPPTEPTP